VSGSLEDATTQAVERKGLFVNPVPYSTKKRDRGHQRGVSVTVKKDAQKLGKRRLRARSTRNSMRYRKPGTGSLCDIPPVTMYDRALNGRTERVARSKLSFKRYSHYHPLKKNRQAKT